MKKLIVLGLFAAGVSAFAGTTGSGPLDGQAWVCSAHGVLSFGKGQVWEQDVIAQGTTDLEAASKANQDCLDLGLDQCIVTECHQQP